ncbi:hypothetical protein [Propionivibrio sp.]|uniref:hypothetical protein n=1 Tax=Propionivibrio sp. TaxID=2212460 RepID=UPI003BEFB54E
MIDEFAHVVAIHPESNQIDVVILRTGARVAGVRVLAEMATGQTGLADLHLPDCTKGYDSDNTGARDITAAISYYGEMPFCVGFLFPEVSQCLFKRDDFRVNRHASDVYHTIDSAGNIELAHPSGAFVRIAESPAHENLTGADYDGIWNIARNTGRAVHIHVEQAGGVASIDIAPGGAITINTASTITATATGAVTVTSSASITTNSPTMTVNAPDITLNGNTVVNGSLTQGKGSSGGGCTMLGPVTVTNDVVAGGKSLMNHVHPDPQGGNTSPPA